jgi:hypothetical protein
LLSPLAWMSRYDYLQSRKRVMSSCRFCKKDAREDEHGLDLIHYSVRHYAHPDCLLKSKGADAWTLLHDWQLDNFPALAANRHGLYDSLTMAIEGRRQPTRRVR